MTSIGSHRASYLLPLLLKMTSTSPSANRKLNSESSKACPSMYRVCEGKILMIHLIFCLKARSSPAFAYPFFGGATCRSTCIILVSCRFYWPWFVFAIGLKKQISQYSRDQTFMICRQMGAVSISLSERIMSGSTLSHMRCLKSVITPWASVMLLRDRDQ